MKTAPSAMVAGPMPSAKALGQASNRGPRHDADACSLAAVFTLVLWLACLVIGALGFGLPYTRPKHPPPPAPPVVAEVLKVELTPEPLPDVEPTPMKIAAPTPEDLLAPPPTPQPAAQMDLLQPAALALVEITSQPIAVAQLTPAIAFALPVRGPVPVVAAHRASRSAPPASPGPAAAVLAAQPLVFGRGEGRQPAPEYPRRALREGQEGTVGIRLSVGEDGRVLTAGVMSPCPWPLLNASALRVVQEHWRFSAGRLRVYDVAIRFELSP